jgi:hypothetical protein
MLVINMPDFTIESVEEWLQLLRSRFEHVSFLLFCVPVDWFGLTNGKRTRGQGGQVGRVAGRHPP